MVTRVPPSKNFRNEREPATPEEMQVQNEASLRGLIPYVLSFGLGSLFAKFAPPWLLLPAFFGCLACVAALTVAAHTVLTPGHERGGKRFALVFVALLLGPAGTQPKSGSTPRVFIMALLFTLGFILVLAVPSGAA
jgi:hypothetical protein